MKEDTNTINATTGGKSNGKWQQPGQSAKETASRPVENKGSELEGIQEQVIDTAKQAYEKVVDTASEAFEKVNFSNATRFVRQYPVQVAIGALAIGFLLGAAVSRGAAMSRRGE